MQSFSMKSFCIFALFALAAGEDCVWNRDTDFTTYPALLMDVKTWMSILPSREGSDRVIRIAEGASVVVACPGTTIIATGVESSSGICEGGSVLNVGGTNYNMLDLGCSSRPSESLQTNVDVCGNGNIGQGQIIGFDINGFDPYNLVYICFDPVLEIALYTTHLLRGAFAASSDVNPDRPSFKSSTGYYSVSPNTCYATDSQTQLMGDLLGDSSVIDVSNSLYFARGHLSPDGDFCTEIESDATYYYINALPQWQSFNNGNWKFLESATRDLAASHGTDFQIWNGPIGILALDDINGNPVDIYLGLFQNEKVLPAPDLMWKVIYEPSTNKGVAVIGSNNPYLTSFPKPVCTDICSSISWITFDVTNLVRGATYCCTVQDLHAAVPNAPDLGSAGLLDS